MSSSTDNFPTLTDAQKWSLNQFWDLLTHTDDAGDAHSDFSEPMNPDSHDGYHYNESDGVWYSNIYSDVPAPEYEQDRLSEWREHAEAYNEFYYDVIQNSPEVTSNEDGSITRIDPDGTTTVYNSDQSVTTFHTNNTVTVTSPDGEVTPIFSTDGNSITYTSPDGSQTTIDTTTGDRTTTYTDADGNTTTSTTTNNSDGSTTYTVTDADGNTTATNVASDGNGNVTYTTTDATGNVTTVNVDSDGNVTTTTTCADGTTTSNTSTSGSDDSTSTSDSSSTASDSADNAPVQYTDPLVLDLDGDGVELVGLDASNAYFDLDNTGFATKTAWVHSDDGILALDANNDGVINNIDEVFGNAEQDGFSELSAYDTNADGLIDAQDTVFADLKVWRDLDGDGNTDAGELQSLSDHQIQSISLTGQRAATSAEAAQGVKSVGGFTRTDGTTGEVADVEFETNRLLSQYVGDFSWDLDVLGLPWLKGYGQLADLHIAMSMDRSLLDQVQAAIQPENVGDLKSSFEQILFKWAGVDGIDPSALDANPGIAPDMTSRTFTFATSGVVLSFEQLGAIKAYTAMTDMQIGDGLTGDGRNAGDLYQEAWDTMFNSLFSRFVIASGVLDSVLPDARYNPFTDQYDLGVGANTFMLQDKIKELLFSGDATSVDIGLLAEFVAIQVDPATSESFNQMLVELLSSDSAAQLITSEYLALVASDFASILVAGSDISDEFSGSSGADALVGLAGDDVINGHHGSDSLYGGAGNDTLHGGHGDDTFTGGTGNDVMNGSYGHDTYLFNLGDGIDTINEFRGHQYTDVLSFGDGITVSDLWFTRAENNLRIDVLGTDDSVVINNWYSSTSYRLDSFSASDNSVLYTNQVDQLVAAMAVFDPQSSGGALPTADVQEQVQSVIAASWQPAA